jgi:hypothetical protein
MFQCDELFKELGAKWDTEKRSARRQTVLPKFPLLSRLSDIASDAVYEPNEVASLRVELFRAQQAIKERQSIRGMDNLIRIARWAAKLKVGIYFGGQ